MNTKPTISVIRHHHNETELQDNAMMHLRNCGFNLVNRYPFDGDPLAIPDQGPTPTLVLGGGQNVTEMDKLPYLKQELHWIEACIENDTPLLGICLGAQLIAHTLGARVGARSPAQAEFGFYRVCPTDEGQNWLPEPLDFMEAHYQEFDLPAGATRLAYSDQFPQQAFQYEAQVLALQFHPEVNLEIHRDWMADSWSEEMASTHGAQSKAQQQQLAPQKLPAQQQWFNGFLSRLFGAPGTDQLAKADID